MSCILNGKYVNTREECELKNNHVIFRSSTPGNIFTCSCKSYNTLLTLIVNQEPHSLIYYSLLPAADKCSREHMIHTASDLMFNDGKYLQSSRGRPRCLLLLSSLLSLFKCTHIDCSGEQKSGPLKMPRILRTGLKVRLHFVDFDLHIMPTLPDLQLPKCRIGGKRNQGQLNIVPCTSTGFVRLIRTRYSNRLQMKRILSFWIEAPSNTRELFKCNCDFRSGTPSLALRPAAF